MSFRILWLSHFVPFPPKGGCFQRSYNLLKHVGARHDVHLLAFKHKAGTHPDEETRDARAELLKYCSTVDVIDISSTTSGLPAISRAASSVVRGQPLTVSLFDTVEMHRRVHEIVSRIKFDVVHFDTISLAPYLQDLGDTSTIMTHHGAESVMIARRMAHEPNPLKRAFFGVEAKLLRRYEAEYCHRFDMNVVMTDLDQQSMQEIDPRATFEIVENGVDVQFFAPTPACSRSVIIFAGRLDQYSNRDGILNFMETTWPLVKASHPAAEIQIIGANPPERLRELAASDPAVNVPGFVDDVRPYFARSAVAICPLRDGGGMRIKILDALAMGKPIVSTTIGCEGIKIVDGQDLLLADTPKDFAAAIGRVFDDAALRESLARKGRAVAERVYSWDSLAGKLLGLYERIVASRRLGPVSALEPVSAAARR